MSPGRGSSRCCLTGPRVGAGRGATIARGSGGSPGGFRRGGRGRGRDNREVLEAIAWRYRTGSPWRDLPAEFGPWQSVYDRHVRWSRDGTYDRIFAAAHTAADEAGDLDWLVAADSSLMRVHQHGATARRCSGNAATVSVGNGREDPEA